MNIYARMKSLQKGIGYRALVLILVLAAVDQASKIFVVGWFKTSGITIYNVLPIFDIYLTYNYGVSYSLFASKSAIGRYMLIALMTAAVVYAFSWLVNEQSRILRLGLIFIIAGAIGNLIDRIWHGAVVDFIYLHYHDFHWFVFNIADIWISVGVMMMVYGFFISGRKAA